MAIEIKETFTVAAPVEAVWNFMNSPENVVACMPGASLKEIVDAKSFVGAVKIKIGAVTAQYQGTITYQEADAAARRVRMLAEGNERGGGTVSGTIVTQLMSLANGGTEVHVTSSVDLTGRIVQVGRGMIEGVSAQIIKKYVANVRGLLEVPANQVPATAQATAPAPASPAPDSSTAQPTASARLAALPDKEDSINVMEVVFAVLGSKLRHFFKPVAPVIELLINGIAKIVAGLLYGLGFGLAMAIIWYFGHFAAKCAAVGL
jgi:carbon monoxide dehydrogenase subunit G